MHLLTYLVNIFNKATSTDDLAEVEETYDTTTYFTARVQWRISMEGCVNA